LPPERDLMETENSLPIEPPPVRERCPVCQKTVYSSTGIHPQCAMNRAAAVQDAKSRKRAAEVAAAKPRSEQAWTKHCPKCRRELHVRRAVCDCGHSFLGIRPR
jgi:hypothetical protein